MRIIFSVHREISATEEEILSLMVKAYEAGAWCFDLPSSKHLKSFNELKRLTDDQDLIGIGHLEAEEGISFLGKPLHRFESKVISTVKKNIVPPQWIHHFFPDPTPSEVFTQKEIDRISFDPSRFERAVSRFDPQESPFLLIGGKYTDWLLGLGRIDLLRETIARVKERKFIPVFAGEWATYLLPKAKSLDASAYAVPINKKWSYFDLNQACSFIKKLEKPVISLSPLADGKLLEEPEEAFSFLFEELKVYSAIAEVASEGEILKIFASLEKIPSLIPPRKT